jgi:hypothetical protein
MSRRVSLLAAHFRYLRTVVRHKAFVLIAGKRTGVPFWRLLVHDLSKFGRSEWSPYVRRFAMGRAGASDHASDPDAWKRAWGHHWHRNPHHWEHWLHFTDDGGTTPLAMPETYVREMVADWMGAGRAYTGTWDARDWYANNRDRIKLHADSRSLAERLLAEVCGA